MESTRKFCVYCQSEPDKLEAQLNEAQQRIAVLKAQLEVEYRKYETMDKKLAQAQQLIEKLSEVKT